MKEEKDKKVLLTVSVDYSLIGLLNKKTKEIGYGASKSGFINQLLKESLEAKQ